MRQLVIKSAGEVCALRWDGSEISISLHFLFLVKCPRGLSFAVVLVLGLSCDTYCTDWLDRCLQLEESGVEREADVCC